MKNGTHRVGRGGRPPRAQAPPRVHAPVHALDDDFAGAFDCLAGMLSRRLSAPG